MLAWLQVWSRPSLRPSQNRVERDSGCPVRRDPPPGSNRKRAMPWSQKREVMRVNIRPRARYRSPRFRAATGSFTPGRPCRHQGRRKRTMSPYLHAFHARPVVAGALVATALTMTTTSPAAANMEPLRTSQVLCSTEVSTRPASFALDKHQATLTCYGNTHPERKFVRGVLDLPGQPDVHTSWVELPPNTTSQTPAVVRTTQAQGSLWGAKPNSRVEEFRCPLIDFGDCTPHSLYGDAILAFFDLIL
jgi:hypothetical protein